jgi:hypothetical protein
LDQSVEKPGELKVFLSYSRRDTAEFAEELSTGLELVGFRPFMDRHDISGGEDWEARLGGLIGSSDTVVFIVSPEAVQSERCAWEVEKAVALSKRLIPIIAEPVQDDKIPAALRRLNYIFFHERHSFAGSLRQLATALRTDLNWIREHTRIGEVAARWQERQHPEALLFRGAELEAAKQWLQTWKSGAPEPTDLQRAFIAAAADAEAIRANKEREQLEAISKALSEREAATQTLARRTTIGLMGAGTLVAISGGFAYWASNAEERFREMRRKAQEAEANSTEAVIRHEAARTDIIGQLAAYSTSAGHNSEDGPPGGNSPYTKAVLNQLANANESVLSALAKAHEFVRSRSTMSQTPFLSSDLNGDIYMRRPSSRRVRAVVVSVDKTGSQKLENPIRDAQLWKSFLEACGYEVTHLVNPSLDKMRQAIKDAGFHNVEKTGYHFNTLVHRVGLAVPRDELSSVPSAFVPNTLFVFFYSGVGAYRAGTNYLMCDDSNVSKFEDSWKTMFSVTEIASQARLNAAASILVLDTEFPDLDPPYR